MKKKKNPNPRTKFPEKKNYKKNEKKINPNPRTKFLEKKIAKKCNYFLC